MPKAGDRYRELVGAVAAALDPTSNVKTEQWIEGPDGERDMDVEMRGMLNGQPHFVLIECKDHARPIGIGYVDAFESKIRDLGPDRAIMFSNSAFTRDALRKAKRVGIEMTSAMKVREKTIRVRVLETIVAKRITVRLESGMVYWFDEQPFGFEATLRISDLTFDGLPVIGWVNQKMKNNAFQHLDAKSVKYLCTFRPEPRWTYQGKPVLIGGLVATASCTTDWVSQEVNKAVSLGYYDHLRRSVVVPPEQRYFLGLIDNEAWVETDQRWQDGKLEPDEFRIHFTIIRAIIPTASGAIPVIDELVAEERVDIV